MKKTAYIKYKTSILVLLFGCFSVLSIGASYEGTETKAIPKAPVAMFIKEEHLPKTPKQRIEDTIEEIAKIEEINASNFKNEEQVKKLGLKFFEIDRLKMRVLGISVNKLELLEQKYTKKYKEVKQAVFNENERIRIEKERIEKERLEKERLEKERIERERLEKEKASRDRALSAAANSGGSKNSTPVKNNNQTSAVRKNTICIGNSCKTFESGSYPSSRVNQLQARIDTGRVVANHGFSGEDGLSTYFLGHTTPMKFLSKYLKIGSVIDVYDSAGMKHSYRVNHVTKTHTGTEERSNTYFGQPSYVYNGRRPSNVLYDPYGNGESIFIQYCFNTKTYDAYVWSAVKI